MESFVHDPYFTISIINEETYPVRLSRNSEAFLENLDEMSLALHA